MNIDEACVHACMAVAVKVVVMCARVRGGVTVRYTAQHPCTTCMVGSGVLPEPPSCSSLLVEGEVEDGGLDWAPPRAATRCPTQARAFPPSSCPQEQHHDTGKTQTVQP
jgi:hypothetical protein